jgi:hypothetical protein
MILARGVLSSGRGGVKRPGCAPGPFFDERF